MDIKVDWIYYRPTADVAWPAGISVVLGDYLQEQFIQPGKMTTITLDYSDDQLKLVASAYFKDSEAFMQFQVDPVIAEFRLGRRKQLKQLGIEFFSEVNHLND